MAAKWNDPRARIWVRAAINDGQGPGRRRTEAKTPARAEKRLYTL